MVRATLEEMARAALQQSEFLVKDTKAELLGSQSSQSEDRSLSAVRGWTRDGQERGH